jgi:transcriptional regulator with XRE-family HTH domain
MESEHNLNLGHRIQERREQMGLSLRELANQAGVTASFLSQLERGQSNPSLKSLQAIAKTLEVSIFYLLVEQSSSSHYLVRRRQGPHVSLSDSNVDLETRTPGPEMDQKMLAFVGRLQPGYDHDVIPARLPTQECIHILKGCLWVELEAAGYILDTGDSITFDGMNLRRLAVSGEQETVYLSFSTHRPFEVNR